MRSSRSARQRFERRSQSRRLGVRFAGSLARAALTSVERDPRGAAGLDERDAPQDGAVVAALVAVGAGGGDQALALVEAERRGRDAAAGCHLADRKLGRHLT